MEYFDFGYGKIEEENVLSSIGISPVASDTETKQQDTKMCITCGEVFPATLKHFRKESKKRKTKYHDGLTSVCKDCAKKTRQRV